MNQTEIDILNLENKILQDRQILNNLIYQYENNGMKKEMIDAKLVNLQTELDYMSKQLDMLMKEHRSSKEVVYVKDAMKLASPATYLSHHPMAGREKVGITYANTEMFKKANFLICSSNHEEKHINILKQIGTDLEFGKITVISPEKHDKMIGFTSQLTHAIAVSLVNSDTESDTKSFIGDSYRDLTRIAMINENLWSELFMANKEYLLGEISNFEVELKRLKNAILNDDIEEMKKIFISSRNKRKEME